MVEPSFESCNRVLEAWPNRLRSLYVLLDRQLLKLPWTTGNLAHKPKCIRNESGFPRKKDKHKNQRIYRRMHCKLRDPAFLSTRRTLPGSQVRIVSPQKDWIETVQKEEDSLQAAEEDSSASDSIDLLTTKAMLHAAQFVSVG